MSATSPSPTALDGLLARLQELGVADQLDAELGALHAELRATLAQLETSNEDLSAAVTDLEAVRSELDRAATELGAVKVELEQRSGDIERITGYLQSVIDGVPGAVVVVDVDQKVRAWSAGAAARWGSSSSDTSGKAFGRLDLKGETPDLISCVRATLAGDVASDPVPVGTSGAEARTHPLTGADGGLEGAVVFVTG